MGSRRVWLPSVFAAACVAIALSLSAGSVVTLSRPMLITALVGLAGIAVSTSLHWSMGFGSESWALRCAAALPFLLSILLIVALMLDADFRNRAGMLGG